MRGTAGCWQNFWVTLVQIEVLQQNQCTEFFELKFTEFCAINFSVDLKPTEMSAKFDSYTYFLTEFQQI